MAQAINYYTSPKPVDTYEGFFNAYDNQNESYCGKVLRDAAWFLYQSGWMGATIIAVCGCAVMSVFGGYCLGGVL